MAQIQDNIALTIAQKTINEVTNLISALNELLSLEEWRDGAGINFVNFEDILEENGDTQHVTSNRLNQMLNTIATNLNDFLDTETIGTKSYKGIIHELRKQ